MHNLVYIVSIPQCKSVRATSCAVWPLQMRSVRKNQEYLSFVVNCQGIIAILLRKKGTYGKNQKATEGRVISGKFRKEEI